MNRLENKCAIVTGAGRGIGKAIARTFLQEGARVMICDLVEDRLFDTARELGAIGDVHAVAGDVTDSAFGDRLLQETHSAFGRLDILVNNAGIAVFSPFLAQTEETWARTLDVNLTSTFKLGQKAARLMAAQGTGGAIVNMASTNGHFGEANLAAYNASKGGVVLLTKTMAIELAPLGIRVNCVAPGFILTDILPDSGAQAGYVAQASSKVPLGRLGRPEEVANLFAFLASDEAPFITGTSIIIDGGQTCQQ